MDWYFENLKWHIFPLWHFGVSNHIVIIWFQIIVTITVRICEWFVTSKCPWLSNFLYIYIYECPWLSNWFPIYSLIYLIYFSSISIKFPLAADASAKDHKLMHSWVIDSLFHQIFMDAEVLLTRFTPLKEMVEVIEGRDAMEEWDLWFNSMLQFEWISIILPLP